MKKKKILLNIVIIGIWYTIFRKDIVNDFMERKLLGLLFNILMPIIIIFLSDKFFKLIEK